MRITVPERIAELVRFYGTYTEAGKAVGIAATTLHRLVRGSKVSGPKTLDKLGLKVPTLFDKKDLTD